MEKIFHFLVKGIPTEVWFSSSVSSNHGGLETGSQLGTRKLKSETSYKQWALEIK